MPQAGSYPAITTLAEDDILFAWQESSDSFKTILVSDAVSELKRLADPALAVAEFSANADIETERIIVGNSGASITLTLPNAEDRIGELIYIANRGTAGVTVEPQSGETINAAADIEISPNEGIVIISLGNGLWQTFGNI